jgi:hypothetical protein
MRRFLPTLVRMRGFSKIVEMPVHHHPRKFGATKYGINNRRWVGIADTLAIRWMRSRLQAGWEMRSPFRLKASASVQ